MIIMLLGQESDLVVQDTSSFAAVGEELSFFQLLAAQGLGFRQRLLQL